MKKRLIILLLVLILVFSFALNVFAKNNGNKGADVRLEEGELHLPEHVKDNVPSHTPPYNNPIDVAGA